MKVNKKAINTYEITLNEKNYLIDMVNANKYDTTFNKSTQYKCSVWERGADFEDQLIPYKQFDIVYNQLDRTYWAWTGDCFRNEEREFRNMIADLFNDGVLNIRT